jgi:drug/metabolite transporter (DMT)-like permease
MPSQLLGLFVIELPALFLLFWLMRRLAASRMTARFFLAPLFATLAGMALKPTSPPLRAWLGLALLAGGAGWLVFAPEEETEVKNWNR